ncbi:MAG: hypothetical protein JO271_15940 [Verrucomicrobia bacterium]|nr:hypothetical protein [Verrucomicrobiota bacterium]
MNGRDRQPFGRKRRAETEEADVRWSGTKPWQEIVPLGVVLTSVTALIFAALSLVHTNTSNSSTQAKEPEFALASPTNSPLMTGAENPVPVEPAPAPSPAAAARAESPTEHLQSATPAQLGAGTLTQNSQGPSRDASAAENEHAASTPVPKSVGFRQQHNVASTTSKPAPRPSAAAEETSRDEPESFRARAEEARSHAERKRERIEHLYQRHLISEAAYAKGQEEYQHDMTKYENQIANYENQVVKYRSQ